MRPALAHQRQGSMADQERAVHLPTLGDRATALENSSGHLLWHLCRPRAVSGAPRSPMALQEADARLHVPYIVQQTFPVELHRKPVHGGPGGPTRRSVQQAPYVCYGLRLTTAARQ